MPRFPHKQRVFSPSPVLSRLIPSFSNTLSPYTTSFSSEDDAVRRAVMADVDTYVDEMIIKFVSGREPLSNWDTYVEKVNGMGIAEVIDIYQKTLNG